MKYVYLLCLLTMVTAWITGCSVTTVARPAPRPTPSVPVMTPEPTLLKYKNPEYPDAAITKTSSSVILQNGWVLLQYNVDESGKPVDIKVVDASPKGLFEKASIEALKGWEYQPPMKDGRRQPMSGLHNLFTFKMM